MMSAKYILLAKQCMKYLAVVIVLLVLFIWVYNSNVDEQTGKVTMAAAIVDFALLIAIVAVLFLAVKNSIKAFKTGVKDLKAMKHDFSKDL